MTGTPIYRFTFYNNTLYPSGIVVPAPLGWREASISLERHKDYNSLIEYFKGSFVFYGTARQVIRAVEDDQGPDAILRCLIEVTYGAGFETVFDGLIDISQQEDIAKGNTFYKQQAPIIRDDFWAKFINRKNIPVDLEATVDLDGNARTAVNKFTLPLPSQKVITRFNSSNKFGIGFHEGEVAINNYIQIDFDEITIDEILEKFSIGTAINTSLPVSILNAEFQGEYDFDLRIESSIVYYTYNSGACTTTLVKAQSGIYISFYIQKNSDTPIQFTETNTATSTIFTYNDTLSLGVSDSIRIYAVIENAGWESLGEISNIVIYGKNNAAVPIRTAEAVNIPPCSLILSVNKINTNIGSVPSGSSNPTYMDISANTIFVDTETDAYLIKDAAESILSKLVGADSVVSSNVLTSDCKRLRAIMKGLHVRGYFMSGSGNPDLNKNFFMKFDDWWEGAQPLLALGLGYTDNNKIEIENVEDFYDPNFTVTFDNVNDLVRSYDLDKIYKSIEIGFSKWSSESDSGVDDPQTKRYYRTKFATIGQDIKILSKWLAASLAIERSRRNRVELGKDDRNDEEIISICVQEYEGNYTPEFSENFDSITGLLNEDFRYNIRDSVARIVKRHQNWLQSCLQHTTGEKLYFSSGEGNYSINSQLDSADCEYSDEDAASGLGENADIDVTGDFIFIPKLYKCKVPMSWEKYKAIRAARKKAIGISRSTSGHVPMFIMELDYKMAMGSAEMTLLLGANADV